MIHLVIPELAPSLNGKNGLLRMHWSKVSKIKARWKVLLLEAADRQRMKGPCHIKVVRHYASQPLEADNAYASLKVLLDAMRYASIIEDDSLALIGKPEVDQVKVPHRKDQRTEIFITERQ
jgi:hypothetical protein